MKCTIGVWLSHQDWHDCRVVVKLGDPSKRGKISYIHLDYGSDDLSQAIKDEIYKAIEAGYDVSLTRAAQRYVEPNFLSSLKSSNL